MDAHRLTIWLRYLVARAAPAAALVGCADEVCTTSWDTRETILPPPPTATCTYPDRAAATPEPDDSLADAAVDASDDIRDAGLAAMASRSDPSVCTIADSGAPEEWLALTCEAACAKLWPRGEVRACQSVVREGKPRLVRCHVRVHECHEPKFMSGRPAASFAPAIRSDGGAALHFAQLAEIEAASIPSFLELARDLERLGFDPIDVAEARRNAVDEARHARSMLRLARKWGFAASLPPVPAVRPPMTLVDLAVANATEGCMAELFAAALATWISIHARDPDVRRVFVRIAEDETRHAAFALRLEVALRARLTDEQKRLLKRARENALADLVRDIAPSPALEAAGLLPPASVRLALANSLFEAEA